MFLRASVSFTSIRLLLLRVATPIRGVLIALGVTLTICEGSALGQELLPPTNSEPAIAVPTVVEQTPQSPEQLPPASEISPASSVPATSESPIVSTTAPSSEIPLENLGACVDPGVPTTWRFDLAYIPTTIDDHDSSFAARVNLSHENPDGFGKGGQFWILDQDIDGPRGPEKFSAETFYFDWFKRMRIERGELALGGGLAAGHLQNKWPHWYDSQYYGGGASVFGQGYYPLVTWESAALGVIGRARLTVLGGGFDDGGSINFGRDSVQLVDEFSWGLELRKPIGCQRDKYLCFSVSREMQNWGTIEFPYSADLNFQGTAFNFGVGW